MEVVEVEEEEVDEKDDDEGFLIILDPNLGKREKKTLEEDKWGDLSVKDVLNEEVEEDRAEEEVVEEGEGVEVDVIEGVEVKLKNLFGLLKESWRRDVIGDSVEVVEVKVGLRVEEIGVEIEVEIESKGEEIFELSEEYREEVSSEGDKLLLISEIEERKVKKNKIIRDALE